MRDYDIRLSLRKALNELHEGDPDTRIIEELGISQGSVRADLAVINGAIHGFEIKSDHDSLVRLPQQGIAYAQCFDAATLVVGKKLLAAAEASVPAWWGITLATPGQSGVVLEERRAPRENTDVKPEVVVQLLWRGELIDIMERLGITRGVRSKTRPDLWRRLVGEVSSDEVRRLVREAIKARQEDWRAAKRRERYSGSSPIDANQQRRQENLRWLLSCRSPDPLD